GQTCAALKRLYVPASIYDQLVDALAKIAAETPMGQGMSEENVLGPLQNQAQQTIVADLVEQARKSGANIVTGGNPDDQQPGYFYPATIVSDIDQDNPLVQVEQFGPALPIVKYDTIDQAIEWANALDVGLGSSVWSADEQRAREVADRLIAGTTWINKHGAVDPRIPFGGVKKSGMGLEFGVEGLKQVALPRVTGLYPLAYSSLCPGHASNGWGKGMFKTRGLRRLTWELQRFPVLEKVKARSMQEHHGALAGTGTTPIRDQDFWSWSQLVKENFPNLELTTPDREAFRAGQHHVSLGEVQLFDMYTGPHTVTQGKVLTSSVQQNLCKLSLQFSGTTHLTQDGRTCALSPGDLALYVAHRPYTLHYTAEQRSLIIQFPQELLHLVQNQVSQVTAVPISADTGLGKVAVPLFEQLAL